MYQLVRHGTCGSSNGSACTKLYSNLAVTSDKAVGYNPGFPLFWKNKIPGVFQSNFRVFQMLSVIVRS